MEVSDHALVILIEMVIISTVIYLVVLLFKHERGRSNYKSAASRPQYQTRSYVRRDGTLWPISLIARKSWNITVEDLEKGAADRGMDGNALARILAYLHSLPRRSEGFMTMKEPSLRSLVPKRTLSENGDEDDWDDWDREIDTEKSWISDFDSDWADVIKEFPRPPDPAHVRSYPCADGVGGSGLTSDNVNSDTIHPFAQTPVFSPRRRQPRTPAASVDFDTRTNISATITIMAAGSPGEENNSLTLPAKVRFWPRSSGKRTTRTARTESWISPSVQYARLMFAPRRKSFLGASRVPAPGPGAESAAAAVAEDDSSTEHAYL